LKQHWWKILSVILLLYVIIAGFIVPLRPGIQSSSPSTAKAGERITLDVVGYNTHWASDRQNIRAWLKLSDDRAVTANLISSENNERELQATFNLPNMPSDEEAVPLTLIVDHPTDGPMVLPTAIIMTKGDNPASTRWQADIIDDLHFTNTFAFPYRNILVETIRNTYFHVPLWMAMYGLLALATFFNLQYLRKRDEFLEERAYHLTTVALVYGMLGIATGMMWAEFTWGQFWSWDIKQTMSLLAILMFVAYMFIRPAIADEAARRRFSAVYGVFAFVMIFPLLYVVPRLAPSLHPGSGGNPAFSSDDMDNRMRMVFYPAIIGYFLFGLWLSRLSFRIAKIRHKELLKY